MAGPDDDKPLFSGDPFSDAGILEEQPEQQTEEGPSASSISTDQYEIARRVRWNNDHGAASQSSGNIDPYRQRQAQRPHPSSTRMRHSEAPLPRAFIRRSSLQSSTPYGSADNSRRGSLVDYSTQSSDASGSRRGSLIDNLQESSTVPSRRGSATNDALQIFGVDNSRDLPLSRWSMGEPAAVGSRRRSSTIDPFGIAEEASVDDHLPRLEEGRRLPNDESTSQNWQNSLFQQDFALDSSQRKRRTSVDLDLLAPTVSIFKEAPNFSRPFKPANDGEKEAEEGPEEIQRSLFADLPSRRTTRQVSVDVDPFTEVISQRSTKVVSDINRSSLDGVEEEKDQITELPRPFKNARFDPAFSFDGTGRRASESLTAEAQELAEKDALEFFEKEGVPKRRSSTVLLNRRKSKYTLEEEKVVRTIGKKQLKYTKFGVIVAFLCLNAVCIVVSWKFEKYWWVFAPVILLGNVLNTIMVLNLLRIWLWRQIKKVCRWIGKIPPPPGPPTHIPTSIAMVLACYCESYDELMGTLNSLNEQERIEQHKKVFLVIVDGQVKGKGMEKSTDRVLVEDIFKPKEEKWFPLGYESWDGVINGLWASAGIWNGTPYICLVKKRNLGKRDGLILIRTLLYKYLHRYENPVSSMGDDFFRWFCNFSESVGVDSYEWLVGVDADTTFNKICIAEMHRKVIENPKLIGCSGLIQVGFRTGNWNLWNVYQNTEYIRAQCLRRMHQALGTGKVSCLPGACQIIKICEETCGDAILIETFGHIPDPQDNMVHQVRALAGEDRNYICLIFAKYPKAITTMALNAIAYTDPPNGIMVFLSQRKRWTLSTCANDMLIVSKNAMNWFERLCSLADILVWFAPIFIMQTFVLFIRACIRAETPVFIVSFATVTMVPMLYGLLVTFWACHGWREKGQYLLGFSMVITLGQFVTPIVISYALWHMDNFSWGKTREVEDDGDPDNKPAHSD